jgi:hypothetical protein
MVALFCASATAAAQQPKVAVLPFSGPQGPKAQLEIARALKKKVDLVSMADWNAAAKKNVASAKSAADYATVANELGVKVVITGAIKRDGGWVLSVSVRQGSTGKPVEKLKYPLRGPRLDPMTLRRLASDIGASVDNTLEGAPPVAEGNDPMATPAEPTRNIEDETPLTAKEPKPKKTEKTEEPEGPRIPRPEWTPWVDASIGLSLSSRNFGFDQAGMPQFRAAVAAGLHLDATAYPLAILGTRSGALYNAVSGIGVGITFDGIFWPDSIPCTRDANGNCVSTAEHYGTTERRLEIGLRWHWNFFNKPMRPDLLFSIQYGFHNFLIEKKADGSDVGPPDVSYSYVTLGFGAKVPVIERLALFALLNVHVLVDAGPIQSATEFGPGGGYGIRFSLGGDVKIWKGLYGRLSAFYEQFGISFNHSSVPPPAKTTTGGATDQYYGGLLSVGYSF